MAKGALFIRWGFPTASLAGKANAVFAEAMEYWKAKQKQGMIDSFEPVFLDFYGGDLSGFLLIRGDREKLNKVRMDPEFESRNQKVALVVPNFGVIDAFIGDDLQRRLSDYQKQLAELG
jgi:hypothetical protein